MIDCVISYYGDGECIDPHSVRASVVLVELRHCYRLLCLHDQRRDQANSKKKKDDTRPLVQLPRNANAVVGYLVE